MFHQKGGGGLGPLGPSPKSATDPKHGRSIDTKDTLITNQTQLHASHVWWLAKQKESAQTNYKITLRKPSQKYNLLNTYMI